MTMDTAEQTYQRGWDRAFAKLAAERGVEQAAERRLEAAAERGARERGQPWLDKAALAEHWRCSVRWIEQRLVSDDPIPHAVIAGRVKFRPGDVEAWRERNPEGEDG